MISHLAIEGYRSLREVIIWLEQLNVVSGPNGSGKSSLYKALRLMADIGLGQIARTIALEGGFDSVRWAGLDGVLPRRQNNDDNDDNDDDSFRPQGTVRKNPISLKLGCAGDGLGYAIDLGLPFQETSMFARDAIIKVEALWYGQRLTPKGLIAERRGAALRVKDQNDKWPPEWERIDAADSFLAQHVKATPHRDVDYFRKRLGNWRFYDHFRVDREAPARQPQVGVRTHVLSDDGSDVAAALQTILEFGDSVGLMRAVGDAFEGSRLSVRDTGGGFVVNLAQRGLMRPLEVGELSDGTLRYLMLCAALLSPRPPELLILNEPESSLSPTLIAPLGRLIKAASRESQIIVVTHSQILSDMLAKEDANMISLEKRDGQTVVAGEDLRPAWKWPSR
jgi:predicted ATPase